MANRIIGATCIVVAGIALGTDWSHPTSDRVDQGLEECWTLDTSTGEVAQIKCDTLDDAGDISENVRYFSTHFNWNYADGGCLIVSSALKPNDQGPYAMTLDNQKVSYTYLEAPYSNLSCIEAFYTYANVSVAGAFR